MQHVILCSIVSQTDDHTAPPLNNVEVVGVADNDNAAIEMITAHLAAQTDGTARARYLRGGGPKGEDITADYHASGKEPGLSYYYRAVPLA